MSTYTCGKCGEKSTPQLRIMFASETECSGCYNRRASKEHYLGRISDQSDRIRKLEKMVDELAKENHTLKARYMPGQEDLNGRGG